MSKDDSIWKEPKKKETHEELGKLEKLNKDYTYRLRLDSNGSVLKKHFPGEISALQIGARIFSIRKSLGITQEEMADKLNISQSGFRRLESGSAFPNGVVLVGLHEIYGVDLTWLLYGTHSSHMDILDAIAAETEQVKFDIFTRLFSYFITKDNRCLLPTNKECDGVEHFAAWNGAYYIPVSECVSDEKEYKNGKVFDTSYKDYIETYMPESLQHATSLLELFKNI